MLGGSAQSADERLPQAQGLEEGARVGDEFTSHRQSHSRAAIHNLPQPDHSIGDVGSDQHRRGTRTAERSRLRTVPPNLPRIRDGARISPPRRARHTGHLGERSSIPRQPDRRGEENAARLDSTAGAGQAKAFKPRGRSACRELTSLQLGSLQLRAIPFSVARYLPNCLAPRTTYAPPTHSDPPWIVRAPREQPTS